MTPSNPSPDTGAGTPLTGLSAEEIERVRSRDREWSAMQPSDFLSTWSRERLADAYFLACLDRRWLLATLDAARSRPATDPAGLDVLREALYRVVGGLTDARVAELMRAAAIPLHGHPIHNEAGYVAALIRSQVTAGIDAALARLAVADGPGLEERLDD